MTIEVEDRGIEEQKLVARGVRPLQPGPTDLPPFFLAGIGKDTITVVAFLSLIALSVVMIIFLPRRVHRHEGLKSINLAHPKHSIDFIFAHSHENLEQLNKTITTLYSIESLSHYAKRVFVYSKSDEPGAVVEVHGAVPLAYAVERLPNIGREGHVS